LVGIANKQEAISFVPAPSPSQASPISLALLLDCSSPTPQGHPSGGARQAKRQRESFAHMTDTVWDFVVRAVPGIDIRLLIATCCGQSRRRHEYHS
jgi:hypothetical protein